MAALDETDFRQLHEQIDFAYQAGRRLENKGRSRELSLTLTKLQEAAFWCDEGFRVLRATPLKEEG
jgi:hypothetical protein